MLFRNNYFPRISSDLIKENGKLKSPTEEKAILERFSKEAVNLLEEKEYLYIRGSDGIYVIYKPEISKGSFGSVSFGYNILTGQWLAAKFINEEKYDQCEYQTLLTTGKLVEQGLFLHEENIIILMEAAKGQEVYELKYGDQAKGINPVKWSLSLWLEVLIQFLERLEELHQLKLVYGDPKSENALYSLAYGILFMIDYGSSGFMMDGILRKHKLSGTYAYLPFEILRESKHFDYNTKTDSYATGVFFHEILFGKYAYLKINGEISDNPSNRVIPKDITELELIFEQESEPLSNDPFLEEHVTRMHSDDPNRRPDVSSSIIFFKEYTKEYNQSHPNKVNIVKRLKEEAKYAEYQRISEAKIMALEPWKAFQRAISESKNVKWFNFNWSKFFGKDQATIQAQRIEAALLNDDLENAKKTAADYIKQCPDDGFAKALKNQFKIYLEKMDVQYRPSQNQM